MGWASLCVVGALATPVNAQLPAGTTAGEHPAADSKHQPEAHPPIDSANNQTSPGFNSGAASERSTARVGSMPLQPPADNADQSLKKPY
jgi:hypothetical protein